MQKIAMRHGRYAIVDDDDYQRVSAFKWHFAPSKSGACVARTIKGRSPQKLHHFILRLDGMGTCKIHVDHRNGDILDNQKDNLRICTPSQNQANSKKMQGTSSKYKGVSFVNGTGKWEAYIQPNVGKINLGRFENEVDAARAYDGAAWDIFGAFAHTNFTSEETDKHYAAVKDKIISHLLKFNEAGGRNGLHTVRKNNNDCSRFVDPHKSEYSGVYFGTGKRKKKWVAMIKKAGRQFYLGGFKDEAEAARVYDQAADILFGDSAKLNFPEEREL